jgi:hypothetical protein
MIFNRFFGIRCHFCKCEDFMRLLLLKVLFCCDAQRLLRSWRGSVGCWS